MNYICDSLTKQCVESLKKTTEKKKQGWSENMGIMVKNMKGYITKRLEGGYRG